jgi:hypothetical protein
MKSRVAGGELWSRPMMQDIARWARLVRDLAGAIIACEQAVKLFLEIVNLAANCDDQKLRVQISVAGEMDL